jgi:hypothetical protein
MNLTIGNTVHLALGASKSAAAACIAQPIPPSIVASLSRAKMLAKAVRNFQRPTR